MRAQAEVDAEVDELAFSLEYDIDRIFRFVRDEVVYDPYAGVLRGGKGTLWGLAGNAADQAVLLKELLDAALVPARYVLGELNEEAAPALLAAGAIDPVLAEARFGRLLVPPPATESEPQVLTPEQQVFVDAFPAFVEEVQALIDRHAAEGIATVSEALAGAGIELPTVAPDVPEQERLRHVWVQYAKGTDWVDLDPSMQGAEPGEVFATDPTPLDELPEDLFHRVGLRLVAEQVSGGELSRTELLAFEAPSHALLGVPISLIHPQPEAMAQIGVAVGGLIQGFRNFVPTLLVGEETIFGAPVTFGTGGGVLDVFGEGAVDGDTLGEWLEVTVATPAGATTAVRTVFDRVGAEARMAGPVDPSAVAPVEFVDAGDPESSFLPLAGLWSLAVVAGVVPERQAARGVPEEVTIDDLHPALQAYHYAREVQAIRQPTLEGVRLFHEEPNVTAFTLRPTSVATDGQSAAIGIDLIHRGLAVAPGGAGTVHPLVAGGVLAHAVEQAMIESGRLEPINLPVSSTSGVSLVFAEAAAQGIPTMVLRPGDEDLIPEMGVGPRGLVAEALAGGMVVILPEREVTLGGRERTGWWLVDPATGATRDQMDDGGGSTMSEYAFIVIKIALCAIAFAGVGAVLGGVARVVAIAVQGGGFGGDDTTGLSGAGGVISAPAAMGCVG